MKIVWDEPKRERNIAVHGFDFAAAVAFDWAGCRIAESYRDAPGRSRYIATGFLDNDLVTLVFSPLGSEAIAVISLRRASRRERKDYEAS